MACRRSGRSWTRICGRPARWRPHDQIGPDPDLTARSEEPSIVSSGATIEPEYPWRYRMDVSCGIAKLGEVNGIVWRTAQDEVPPQWTGSVEGDRLVVDLLLDQETATLAATANGHTVTYEPAPDPHLARPLRGRSPPARVARCSGTSTQCVPR